MIRGRGEVTMKKQQSGISLKILPVLTAMILFVLAGFPVKAAPGNEAVYATVFDSTYYYDHNPDLQIAFGNNGALLLNHFLTCGMAEGRQGCEEFNVQYYKANYNDLQAAFGENLPNYYLHYITNGKAEGRIGNGTFAETPDSAPVNNRPTEADGNDNRNVNTEEPSGRNDVVTDFSGGDNSGYAYEVVELVNKVRAENGVGSVSTTSELMRTAQIRAEETTVLFQHTRPDGSSCFTAFDQNGVRYRTAGENIAAGQMSPAGVMQSWMNSPGHRANILNPDFNHIGVGCYQANGGYGIYWTQCFTN